MSNREPQNHLLQADIIALENFLHKEHVVIKMPPTKKKPKVN